MTDENKNKPNISLEQLKQLMVMQHVKNAGNSGAAMPQQLRTKKQKLIHLIALVVNSCIHVMDHFISFVIKKHDDQRSDVLQRSRSPILFAMYVMLFFLGICGCWAALAPLDSASIATGILMPNTNKKIIQHKEGGIIKAIFVKEGDKVLEGDPLIELQDTQIKSSHSTILNQYLSALANESRLIAQRDKLDRIEFPEFLKNFKSDPAVAKIIETQENLFKSRKELIEAEISQLKELIESTKARKGFAKKNLEVSNTRVEALQSLDKQGFVRKSELLAQENDQAKAKSMIADADADNAKYRIEILKTYSKYDDQTLKELKETQVNVGDLREKYNSITDSLDRVIIRSPVDGVVNVIHFHTIGGVIQHSEKIMEIAPTNDHLVIEAKVPSRNIDSVVEGLPVKIRFSAFSARSMPVFNGKIIRLSHDIVQDKNLPPQPENYYIARIEVDMEEVEKFTKKLNLELHPGMQAEVQIITGTRTMLGYLLDPIKKSMDNSFRER